MNKRYAVIVTLRNQVTAFVDNPLQITSRNAILIDLENHPQKDEVELDWFYDKETNTFSKEGEVIYPEISQPEPTQLDRIEEAINTSIEKIRQEGADALTLELIEKGIL